MYINLRIKAKIVFPIHWKKTKNKENSNFSSKTQSFFLIDLNFRKILLEAYVNLKCLYDIKLENKLELIEKTLKHHIIVLYYVTN